MRNEFTPSVNRRKKSYISSYKIIFYKNKIWNNSLFLFHFPLIFFPLISFNEIMALYIHVYETLSLYNPLQHSPYLVN